MKRIYACLAIVAALLVIAFYSSFRVQQFAEEISEDLDNAMEAIRNSDLTGARQALTEGAKLCDRMREGMNHLLRTEDFTELEAALRAADGHLEWNAPEEAFGELRRAQVQVETLAWLAQRIISGATGNVVAPNCLFGSTTTTDMKIYYEMTCGAGGFTLTRTWDIVNDAGCGDVGGTWYYCQFPPGCSGVTGCGNYPFTPYNPAADTVTGTATSSCNPLSLSFSLSGTTKLSDPVGGGVTVTP